MAGETTPPGNPAGHAGLLDNLLALASALAGFFESRAALLAKESKTALLRLLVIEACVLAAFISFAVGYIFLVAGGVVGIARIAHISWVWVALVVGGAHFVCALIFLLIARAKMAKPLFRATIDELKKDREWLENLEETTPN